MTHSISSENVLDADNQQERLKIAYWILDFIDINKMNRRKKRS